jgi:putative ABC transport system substrate-binding protein
LDGALGFCRLVSLYLSATLAQAQQPAKIPRIGFLFTLSPSISPERVAAFRQGLRDLGYFEGKNIIVEIRSAQGKAERLTELADELVRLDVDVIITAGPTPTAAAKKATRTIPIVMTFDIDPVGSGHVASLARPGGNITGLSTLAPEISGKHLEFLKETVPGLSRVALFRTSTVEGSSQELKQVELAAGGLGLRLRYQEVRDPKDIETSFQAAKNQHADAMLVGTSRILYGQRAQVVKLAVQYRLPAMYIEQEFVLAGGLMAYATSISDLYRRAATYVDKILKGAKPADLPIEQPTKFDFVINLKAAKQIGLIIPPNVLARADRVIR